MPKKQVKQIEEVKSEECPNNSEEEIKVVKKSSKKLSKEPKLQVEMYEPPKMKSSKKVVESEEKPKKKVVKTNSWIDYMKTYNKKNNTTGFSAASASWKKLKEDKLEKEAEKSKKKSKK